MRLSHAQSARTILKRRGNGALSTLATDPAGHPYGSLVSYAVTEGGDPIFLLSDLAEHVQNLNADGRASLLATDSLQSEDPLADGRVSVMGDMARLEGDDREKARETFLEAHPEASIYANFKDFNFYQLKVSHVRYIGGFGRMSWVSIEDWRKAQPDPLWKSSAGIIEHMNDDHDDALLLYAKHQGETPEATSARMVAVDQHGFDMTVEIEGKGRPGRVRVLFGEPKGGSGAVRRALVALVKEAREALGEPPPEPHSH